MQRSEVNIVWMPEKKWMVIMGKGIFLLLLSNLGSSLLFVQYVFWLKQNAWYEIPLLHGYLGEKNVCGTTTDSANVFSSCACVCVCVGGECNIHAGKEKIKAALSHARLRTSTVKLGNWRRSGTCEAKNISDVCIGEADRPYCIFGMCPWRHHWLAVY